MDLSVVIPTHNPSPVRLRRTLEGLRAQSLPMGRWETILVDNDSSSFPDSAVLRECAPENLAVVRETKLGLTAARRCGFRAACGAVAVLVDDDNVLAPDYLSRVLELLAAHPRVGACGGKSLPEFEVPPPSWTTEFHGLLALRDLGAKPLISHGLRPPGTARNDYPLFAPFGAGMAVRREAWMAWLDAPAHRTTFNDRTGCELTSGGDNDIILTVMQAGWEVAYFPELSLLHLIPSSRLDPSYLARLNRGIQKSWMQVLSAHNACPWPPLTPLGARLRKLKAWCARHPWSSPAARIRYAGAAGHFEGRVPR
ncbi:MAG TPA: glycosyltransferase [Opitutaceae bacterium]|nr:glycosyltransferase [Opitutaceae bacterium]